MTLEEFFRKSAQNGIIDFNLRAIDYNGIMTFYIHPAGVSGDTLDYEVTGDTIIPRGWATGFSKNFPCNSVENQL